MAGVECHASNDMCTVQFRVSVVKCQLLSGGAVLLGSTVVSWLDRNLNLDKALNLLKKAVELEPNDGYIIDSLGWAFYLTGVFDKSIFYL